MIYETGRARIMWNQASKTVSFDGTYSTPPVVTATLYDSSLDLNITIKDITTSGFTILLSDKPGTLTNVSYVVFGD